MKLLLACLAVLIASTTPTLCAPHDACAARAEKAATDQAADTTMNVVKFAEVKPSKSEAGAGDRFFDVTFSRPGSNDLQRYHVIMWCAGTKAPLAMAIQRRYD